MGWHVARERRTGLPPTEMPVGAPAEEPVGSPVDMKVDAGFDLSAVDLAAVAKLRGDRYFQVELDHATLTSYTPAGRRGRRCGGATDLLGQIEELGWTLEHVAWWRDDSGVRGVYLFRTVEVERPRVVAAEPSREHGPTHRRDLAV